MFVSMKNYYSLISIAVCVALACGCIALVEAVFANIEGEHLFVYTLDYLKCFLPFTNWHFAGSPVNGGVCLLLQVFFSQFFCVSAGIYIVMSCAIALWLWLWDLFFKHLNVRIWIRCFVLFPLLSFLFLFVFLSNKFPEGTAWGLILSLALCLGALFFIRRSLTREFKSKGSFVLCLIGVCSFLLLSGLGCWVFLGFWPTFFFVICVAMGVLSYFNYILLGCLLFASFLPLLAPYVYSKNSAKPAEEAYDWYVVSDWKANGWSSDWHLYLSFQKTLLELRNGRFREALAAANSYWFSDRTLKKKVFSAGEQYFRAYLAEATKSALLFSGELNNRFLEYGTISEMVVLFHKPLHSNYYNSIYAQFYFKTGALTATAFEGVNVVERDGLRADLLPLLAITNTCLGQYELSEKYLYLLRHSLFYRQWALSWTRANENAKKGKPNAFIRKKRKDLALSPSSFRGKSPDKELLSLWNENKNNLYVAEYICTNALLNKELALVYEYAKYYKSLGYALPSLPIYLQEALLLFINYGNDAIGYSIVQSGLKGLENFKFDPLVVAHFENLLQDRWNMELKRMPLDRFIELYESNYAFFFFFLKNMSSEEIENIKGSTPLAH